MPRMFAVRALSSHPLTAVSRFLCVVLVLATATGCDRARSHASRGATAPAARPSVASLVPGATVSGSTLVVNRPLNGTPYTFNLSFTACSLDDPADGYGDHTQTPQSGGSWCRVVASRGSGDSQPVF